jgi:hypothetical protein
MSTIYTNAYIQGYMDKNALDPRDWFKDNFTDSRQWYPSRFGLGTERMESPAWWAGPKGIAAKNADLYSRPDRRMEAASELFHLQKWDKPKRSDKKLTDTGTYPHLRQYDVPGKPPKDFTSGWKPFQTLDERPVLPAKEDAWNYKQDHIRATRRQDAKDKLDLIDTQKNPTGKTLSNRLKGFASDAVGDIKDAVGVGR